LFFCSPLFPKTSLKSYFSKEKTEKKKAKKGCPQQAKGNGIIGGDPLGRKPFMP